MTQQLVQMENAIAGLHASTPQPLPFAPSLEIRAFLLERDQDDHQDNLLIYSVADLESEAAAIEDLGGISRQYLNHWHESMFISDWVTAPLFAHQADRESIEEASYLRGTFSRRHHYGDDFEVIPTPGHTSGATAYLWDSGEHRMLFTGDSIYLSDGEWRAAVLESSDIARYIESLEQIRELDFDLLVPWAASAGQPYYAVTNPADARERIDAILERLRRGENG